MIFGGRSEIGLELATRLAPGATVVLAARRADDLDEQVAAVRAAGATAVHVRDSTPTTWRHTRRWSTSIVAEHGPIGTAVLAFGILGDQARAEKDAGHAAAIVHTDYVAQVSLLTVLADSDAGGGRGDHRGVLVGGRCAGAPRQLCVRVGQGGSGRVLQRSRRRSARFRGAAAAGAAGFRDRADDRGHGTGAVVQHPPQVADATARALARGQRTVSGFRGRWQLGVRSRW